MGEDFLDCKTTALSVCMVMVLYVKEVFAHFIDFLDIKFDNRSWIRWKYCMPKKSWSILYSKYLYGMGQDFFDIQYDLRQPHWVYVMYGNGTLSPRSLSPFYIVSYYIKWVKTFWTDSTIKVRPSIFVYEGLVGPL